MEQPYIGFACHGELKILFCDRVPIFVHHHDTQEIANCGEEEAVEIVFHTSADLGREGVEGDLADNDEENTKRDIAKRPSVFERVEDEGDL